MQFTFFEDPGHGWLRVDVQSAESLGLNRESFSHFSYAYGPWFYLEEDCDAGAFIEAYKAKHGSYPPLKSHYSDRPSPIRNYPSIRS